MEKKIIKGIIKSVKEYDSGDGVYIGEEVLSKELEELCGKEVTVRFYVSNTEKAIDELKENLVLTISGALEADYGDCYSEYTGYLWTDDNLEIGNHDLLEDISQHEGKFAYIEIEIH